MMSYGPAHWFDYQDMHAIIYTWYYISCSIQQSWNQTTKCTSLYAPKLLYAPRSFNAPKYTLNYIYQCTGLYTPSQHDSGCKGSTQDTLKYALSVLPSILPSMLSMRLLIALHDTISASSAVYSQVSSQDVLMRTPEKALKSTSNCTQFYTSSLLYILLWKLSRCSQVFLWVCCHINSHTYSQVPLQFHSWYNVSLLDFTSQHMVSYWSKHTSELTFKGTPNRTQWYCSSLVACIHSNIVWALVLDRRFGYGSGSEPNWCQIGGPGRQ